MGLFDFLSTPSPVEAAMKPGDQTASTGIFSKPGTADALMALGAGLLSERGAGGLAQGFAGAQQAFQNADKMKLQQEQNAILNSIKQQNANSTTLGATAKALKIQQDIAKGNMPKFIQKIGDDAALVQNADGTFETISSADMQAAGLRMNNGKLERANAIAQYKYDNAPLTAAEQKLADERKDAVAGVQTTKGDVADLIAFGDKMKPGIGSQLAGTGIGKTVAALGSGYSEDAAAASQYQQKLSSVLTNKWLDIGAKLKGAQSDKEGAQLLSTLPDPKADYQTVIRPWLLKYQAWLDDTEKKASEKLTAPRTPDTATGSGSSAPASSGLPGLSPKASKYFQ